MFAKNYSGVLDSGYWYLCSLPVLKLELYKNCNSFWEIVCVVLLEPLHSCVPVQFVITPWMAITVTRVPFVIKEMVTSQIKKMILDENAMVMNIEWNGEKSSFNK